MRISDWSSDVCSSDLRIDEEQRRSRKIRHCPGLKRHTPARPHKRTADKTGRYIGAEFCRDLQERLSSASEPISQSRVNNRNAAAASAEPPPIPAATGKFLVRVRSEENTSELQSLMRISYAVFCLKKKIR